MTGISNPPALLLEDGVYLGAETQTLMMLDNARSTLRSLLLHRFHSSRT